MKPIEQSFTFLLIVYSIYGGFVRWQMGVKEDGSDSIAIQVADENVSRTLKEILHRSHPSLHSSIYQRLRYCLYLCPLIIRVFFHCHYLSYSTGPNCVL